MLIHHPHRWYRALSYPVDHCVISSTISERNPPRLGLSLTHPGHHRRRPPFPRRRHALRPARTHRPGGTCCAAPPPFTLIYPHLPPFTAIRRIHRARVRSCRLRSLHVRRPLMPATPLPLPPPQLLPLPLPLPLPNSCPYPCPYPCPCPSQLRSITARAPVSVRACIDNFKKTADVYMRKSQGYLEPRDLLHGSFLRFDKKQNGRVDLDGVKAICAELGVRMDEREVRAFTTWFDTNGSDSLDYNELVRQLYGEDIATRSVKLPKVGWGLAGETKTQLLVATQKSAPHRVADALYDGAGVSMTSTMALGLGSTTKSSEWIGETGPGSDHQSSPKQPKLKRDGMLKVQTLARNMVDIESRDAKEKKKLVRQKVILEEKTIIQNKLASIERQRKKILEDYRSTRQTTQVRASLVVWLFDCLFVCFV